jgi:hypothetical protein
VDNYFNYFTEIEQHFLRRRGGGLLLSTLDWALIETWKDAGIPLEAVLRGIDAAFDRYDLRPSKTKKINSLAYCSQAVLTAAEEMKEAAVGAVGGETARQSSLGSGFEPETIAAFLRRNAELLASAKPGKSSGLSVQNVFNEASQTLRALAGNLDKRNLQLEDLERRLTVIEEKMFAALLAATADEEIVAVREEADRGLAPYRRKMSAAQIGQLQKQYVHKRLLEKYGVPRLSLFYM